MGHVRDRWTDPVPDDREHVKACATQDAGALCGPHARRLALELSVTTEVIHAWQEAAHDGALWTRIAST